MNAEVAAYIGRWRPSSVSPQAAAFARDVITAAGAGGAGAGEEPAVGGGQARRLRASGWAWSRCRRCCCTRRWPSGSPGARRACRAVARRTLRTNLRFIGRRVVPQLYPADLPLPRERAKQPYSPAEIGGYLALADAQPTAERRMRAAGLVCLGAGAGLIRGDLRDVRGTDVACRSGGVSWSPCAAPGRARCRCWPATTPGCWPRRGSPGPG